MKHKIYLTIVFPGVLFQTVSAQDETPLPKTGGFYPVGTTLTAVCKFADLSHKESI